MLTICTTALSSAHYLVLLKEPGGTEATLGSRKTQRERGIKRGTRGKCVSCSFSAPHLINEVVVFPPLGPGPRHLEVADGGALAVAFHNLEDFREKSFSIFSGYSLISESGNKMFH